VVAGFLYYDARTDDARLTLTILRTAVLEHGAVAANYARVTSLLKDDAGAICGARIVPQLPGGSGEVIDVRAKAVVNATGIWADEVRSLDGGSVRHDLRPAKGIHLTVPRSKLPCDVAAIIPVAADRRAIFVIPWGEYTYLGTTDTDYTGSLDDPDVADSDVEYVLSAVNAVVTEPLSRADVTGTWAGLRPLLASSSGHKPPSARTADLSRRHRVIVSDDGLVTITGGKLTTYRKMAEDTLTAVGDVLGRKLGASPTRRLRLRGADGSAVLRKPGAARSLGVEEAVLDALVGRFGGEAAAVAGLIEQRRELRQPLVPGLPYFAAEAVYAVRYEMAQCLEDTLARRTRALLLDATASRQAAGAVAALMGEELGWDEQRIAAEIASLDAFVEAELHAVGDGSGDAGDGPAVEVGA
jgi:glycerol-3-phosphate dehydrogenase